MSTYYSTYMGIVIYKHTSGMYYSDIDLEGKMHKTVRGAENSIWIYLSKLP